MPIRAVLLAAAVIAVPVLASDDRGRRVDVAGNAPAPPVVGRPPMQRAEVLPADIISGAGRHAEPPGLWLDF